MLAAIVVAILYIGMFAFLFTLEYRNLRSENRPKEQAITVAFVVTFLFFPAYFLMFLSMMVKELKDVLTDKPSTKH